MKIHIQTDGHNMKILLPTNWVFSKTGASIAAFVMKKHAPEEMAGISPEAIRAFCAEIRRIKRRHGRWDLVEISGSGGEKVIITL